MEILLEIWPESDFAETDTTLMMLLHVIVKSSLSNKHKRLWLL